MANSIYELYLKYLVNCCCHLDNLKLFYLAIWWKSGKYAYLVELSDILTF